MLPHEPSPFDSHYGLRLDPVADDGACTGHVEIRPELLQPTGVVHGGVHASLAEALASHGTNWHVRERGEIALGMSNATNFLRPVAGGSLHGRATPVHRGRTTWVWDVEIADDDGRVCAVSRVTLAVRPGQAG